MICVPNAVAKMAERPRGLVGIESGQRVADVQDQHQALARGLSDPQRREALVRNGTVPVPFLAMLLVGSSRRDLVQLETSLRNIGIAVGAAGMAASAVSMAVRGTAGSRERP